jgi:hypothetical protein
MRIGPHAHPCSRCHVKTECCGDIIQNYDGWPEWVCVEFDIDCTPKGWLCEDCHMALSTDDDTDVDTDNTEGTPTVGTPNSLCKEDLA